MLLVHGARGARKPSPPSQLSVLNFEDVANAVSIEHGVDNRVDGCIVSTFYIMNMEGTPTARATWRGRERHAIRVTHPRPNPRQSKSLFIALAALAVIPGCPSDEVAGTGESDSAGESTTSDGSPTTALADESTGTTTLEATT